jgi:FAD-linked oxidoreductase
MSSTHRRRWRNWSGSVEAVPNYRSFPASTPSIQAEVLRCAEAGERLRVGGSGQSFTPLCWTDENLMSLNHFTGIESCNHPAKRVWVRAGTRLAELAQQLSERGLALEVMGPSGQQTLAGAISTGTHGSGTRFGNLSTLVTGLKLVGADGSLKTYTTDSGDVFDAVRLSLGALGVITHVELQCVDAYRLHYRSHKGDYGKTLSTIERLKNSHRHFEFCWFPYNDTVKLKYMDLTGAPESSGHSLRVARNLLIENAALWTISEVARRIPRSSERISGIAAWGMSPTDTVGEPYRRYTYRHLVRFNEISFALPAKKLPEALEQLGRVIRALRFQVHFPLEVRFVAADKLWLSPSYERDTAFVSARVYQGMPYEDYFSAATEIFDRYDGRPHWGRIHHKAVHEFAQLYPRLADFQQLRTEMDPRGVFLNPHLCSLLGIDEA